MIAPIGLYRQIAPLQVWRTRSRNRPAGWVWVCHLCGHRDPAAKWFTYAPPLTWESAVRIALDHLAHSHGCPSMRASGEPCDEYCADCGGKGWIK